MKQSVVQRALVAAGFWGAVLALTSTLTACVPLVLGGAAAGTMMVATDRRTSGAQRSVPNSQLSTLPHALQI